MPRTTSTQFSSLSGIAAVVLVVCGVLTAGSIPAAGAPESAGRQDARTLENDLSRLYAAVRPAIVGVVSSRVSREPIGFARPGSSSLSCRYLVASGIVIGDRGCVVTTARAAQPGDSIVVHFPGGRHVPATYLGMDPALHITVLRLTEPGPYPSLQVEHPEEGTLPEWVAVVAYGPWAGDHLAEPSLTLSQRSSIEMVPTNFRGAPAALWRIEAPFSPGNGGGALVTLDGRWLGLITGVVAGGAGSSFAPGGAAAGSAGIIVPAEIVVQSVAEIESGRRATQGFLGLRGVRPAPPEGAEKATGVLVAEVLPGSPAACAGIRPGDIVLRFGGVAVDSVLELTQLVRARQPGERISLALTRGDQSGRVELALGDRRAAGLYMTRRRQQLGERRALKLELGRLEERRTLIERRLEIIEEAAGDPSPPAPPNPDNPQTSAAH